MPFSRYPKTLQFLLLLTIIAVVAITLSFAYHASYIVAVKQDATDATKALTAENVVEQLKAIKEDIRLIRNGIQNNNNLIDTILQEFTDDLKLTKQHTYLLKRLADSESYIVGAFNGLTRELRQEYRSLAKRLSPVLLNDNDTEAEQGDPKDHFLTLDDLRKEYSDLMSSRVGMAGEESPPSTDAEYLTKVADHKARVALKLLPATTIDKLFDQSTFTTHSAAFFAPDETNANVITSVIVNCINSSEQSLRLQLYSFTSVEIGDALEAYVLKHPTNHVYLLMDNASTSGRANQYPRFVALAKLHPSLECRRDCEHDISHNKIIIIDSHTVINGSFNMTPHAQQRNAENIVVHNDMEQWNVAGSKEHEYGDQKTGMVGKLTLQYLRNFDAHWKHGTIDNKAIVKAKKTAEKIQPATQKLEALPATSE